MPDTFSATTFGRVRAVFHQTYAAPPGERAAILDRACGDAPHVREQVEALLRAFDDAGDFLGDGADPHAGPWPAAGDTLAEKYTLVRVIGEGGMGQVWRAEQAHPIRRAVAVKLVRGGRPSPQVLRRFESERQALAWLDHPNVAKVLDAGTTAAGHPYFVMELIAGVPLVQFCDERHLTVARRLDVFRQVCAAAHHAHQKGILHRDLKPSNVLVEEVDGRAVAKVIDFGLVKVISPAEGFDAASTAGGVGLGTPQYMAPEQLDGDPDRIDTRADVYALGVVLFELLTGDPPLRKEWVAAATPEQLLREIRQGETPRPSDRLSQMRGAERGARDADPSPQSEFGASRFRELDWIVMKALEKEPARRYDSASALADDVGRFLRGEPVAAAPPSTSYRVRKFVRRHRVQVLAAAAVAVALVVGVIGTTLGLVRAEASARRANLAADAEREQRREAEGQRERAEAEAEAARTHADLFLNTLGRTGTLTQLYLDGVEEVNPNITVGELLDRATRDLAARPPTRPLVEADVRLVLGTAYLQVGPVRNAVPHLVRAAALRREQLSVSHPTTLTALYALARGYQEVGEFRNFKDVYRELVEIERSFTPQRPLELVRALNGLACALREESELAAAAALLEEAKTAALAHLGPRHHLSAVVRHNLAATYRDLGDLKRSAPMFAANYETARETFGHDHPVTLDAAYGLAEFYRISQDNGRAIPLYQQTLDRMRTKFVPTNRKVLDAQCGLARCYNQAGNYDKAVQLYRGVLPLLREALGETSPYTLATLGNLAVCLSNRREWDEAEKLLVGVVRDSGAVLGTGHRDTSTAASHLGYLYADKGRFDLAILHLVTALEFLVSPRNPHHAKAHDTIHHLGTCFLRERRPEAGRETLLRLLRGTSNDHANGRRLAVTVATELNRLRGHSEAESVLRACLSALPADANRRDAMWARAQLGVALHGQGKWAEAEPLLLAGYEGLVQLEANTNPEARAAYRSHRAELGWTIVALYEAWEKPLVAAKWRAAVPREVAPAPRAK